MRNLWQDIRFGFRVLLKSPGFTAVAVLSLALGMGANTTIFTIINAIFLHPLPVEEPARVVSVFTTDERNAGGFFTNFMPASYPNYEDFRDKNQVFSALSATFNTNVSLSTNENPERVNAQLVSANFFTMMGVKPARGRAFLPDEDRVEGAASVVVLSDGLWRRLYGGDVGLVGKTILINRQSFTVVGIAPPNFKGINVLGGPDLWMPISMHNQVVTGLLNSWFRERRALIIAIVGRLKPGISLEQARAGMRILAKQLEQEYPLANEKRSVVLLPVTEAALNPNVRGAGVKIGIALMGAVGLVLLIACANVANLLLARATRRQREMAIRLSLGAGRGRLVRQLLTESILLALAGGALGILIAYWSRDLLWSLRPPFLGNGALDLTLDVRVLLFTLALSVLTGIVFGLVPSLQASRPGLMTELKDRTSTPSHSGRWYSPRSLLVMAQVGLSVVALVGAGLFLRSLQNAQRIDPGFDAGHLLAMSFDPGALGYDAPRREEFYRQVIARVGELPMVQSASISENALFAGGLSRTVFPDGVDTSDRRGGKLTPVNPVEPGYFSTLGIPILRGRDFTAADRDGAPMVAIVNQTLADRLWPGQNPLGKRMRFFGEDWRVEVVGVAKDSKYFTLGEPAQSYIYFPLEQHHSSAVTLYVRTPGTPAAALGTVRDAVQAMDRNLPLTGVGTVAQTMDRVLWLPRMGAGLLGTFGLLALVLASFGVYGVMSYSVSQRTQEIGIRITLGAQRRDVLGLILHQAILITGMGIAAGLVAAFLLTRGLSSLLFGVGSLDVATFTATPLLLMAVALAASYIPARRATRVDPMVALRYE